MWKPETDNRILPTRLPPIEGQQKETQDLRWHKDATGKVLWIGEDNELSQGNIDLMDGWQDQYTDSSVLYSQMTLMLGKLIKI